jgi:hypothetical protein
MESLSAFHLENSILFRGESRDDLVSFDEMVRRFMVILEEKSSKWFV